MSLVITPQSSNARASIYKIVLDGATTAFTLPSDSHFLRAGDTGLCTVRNAPTSWDYPSALGGMLTPIGGTDISPTANACVLVSDGTITGTLSATGANTNVAYAIVVWNPDRPSI